MEDNQVLKDAKNTVELGPLTPQEVDALAQKLKELHISFEIIKDEEAEKRELKDDVAYLVKKVEFRTENYLAQIFYFRLSETDLKSHIGMFKEFGFTMPTHLEPIELSETAASSDDLAQNKKIALERHYIKAWVAITLILMLILSYIWSTIKN